MKKIFFILFVFYLSFINCQHNFTEEEILNFFDRAMDTIIEKYANVTDDCGDTFSANLTFGVLFTNDDDYEKDLNNIKNNYSSNVIDLAFDEDMENGLIDKDNKFDNTQQKVVIYKNQDHDDDKISFLIIEANFTNLKSDDIKCPFVVALDSMFRNADFDIEDLVGKNYKVINFNFN